MNYQNPLFNVLEDKKENRFASDQDEYGSDTMSEINIVGRIILNIWRIMRHEVKSVRIILDPEEFDF